jgi:phage recombination protein Bet
MNAITKHESGGHLAEADLMHVLQSSLYPGASLDSIRMVLGYCKAAGLDPMQKPVHIVPMWDRQSGSMRDVIMPGVNLYRIQASRSGQFAGVSEPEFGPDVTTAIGGQQITFPEWCRVVVRRQLSSGHIADFTAREYWMENYAVKGGKEKSIAPNAMWTKRPRGQIAKCATAQALRAAFPEIAAQYTHEELEGKALNDFEGEDVIGQPKNFGLTPARAKIVRAAAGRALQKFNEDDEYGAYQEVESLQDNNEELMALWSILRPHSALRSALKRIAQEIKERDEKLAEMTPPAAATAEGVAP